MKFVRLILFLLASVALRAGIYDDCLIISGIQINGDTSDLYSYVIRPSYTTPSIILSDPALSNTGTTQGTLVMATLGITLKYDPLTETADVDPSHIDYALLNNLPTLGTASTQNSTAFATAAQGVTADGAQPLIAVGTTAQYWRGDKTWVTSPTNLSSFTNGPGYITGITSANVTTALGFTPYNATNPSAYITQAGARTAISLTTTGSGAASYNNSTGVLNVPTATAGVTSVTAGTGLSGGTITTTGTISMPSTGTSGTYSGVTTDAQGRVTAGTTRSFTNSATKTLVTSASGQGGVQLSTTRDARADYWVDTSITTNIGGTSTITVFIEIASTNSATPGDWTTIAKASNGQTITLAVALLSVQPQTLNLGATVPAGQYVRIRYSTAGTASATYGGGQEVLL